VTATQLALLEGFTLTRDGAEVALPTPARRVLAFLALRDQPMLRDYIAETLWIDATRDHAAGSMRSALFTLRRACPDVVDASNGRLVVGQGLVVDVREAITTARRLLSPTPKPSEFDLRGLPLSGDILPDWYDDWVVIERERFRELRVHALEVVCARLTSVGRFGEAMEAGLAAVRGEPLRESAHRAVISVHLAEGNRAQALAEYRRFRDLLERELAIAPSARMDELIGELQVPITRR
jgi:DNA-binding SARP family transcriptional activator